MTLFVDTGQILSDFEKNIYVRCPNCGKCASMMDNHKADSVLNLSRHISKQQSSVKKKSPQRIPDSRKISCLHCAYTKVYPKNEYFRWSLWLQTSCCSETLWALNREHLDVMAQYVGARLRLKYPHNRPYRNKTLVSRLPFWISSAKNRDEVLKGIRRLYALLEEV